MTERVEKTNAEWEAALDPDRIGRARDKALPQLGSVGGGNHFIEMQVDRDDGSAGGPTGEAGVVALVRAREYDAGAVSKHALTTLREKGQLQEGDVRVFWSSPGYSHCCFTARRAIDDALAQRITAAFTAMRIDDPEHRQVLELEGCKGFIPGTPEGYDMLEAAAEAEGLV